MKRRKRSCSRRMLRPLRFTGTDCPCPLGAAGPAVLLQHRRKVWRTGAGAAEKISALEIKTICPLHGPMLTEDLGEYLRLYDLWSQWKPEEPEGILIVHASIHGNTAYASEALKSKLEGKGAQVTMCDLTATDLSYAVTSAFYCGKLVLACSTYDGGLFPPMKEFLEHLQTKGFRNRRVGLIENGSWAPAAARLMRTKLEEMKDIHLYETVVSLRGALNQTSEAQMDALVAELCAE